MEIFEYRGVEGLVYAEVTEDSTTAYTTGTVKELVGVSEIGKATDTSSETHYYDNAPAIVINSTGADTISIDASAIPFDTLADITGQTYDAATGTLIEGAIEPKYIALGYKTKKTNGDEVYVWRLKGRFQVPDSTHHTEDDGTDANGQSLVYTGIQTTHKFTKTGKGAKAVNVDMGKNLIDGEHFFDSVQTPDTIVAKQH